jgi:3-oxocholest-4-en-26-oyl-CoA dehydrogenase alpha subunit
VDFTLSEQSDTFRQDLRTFLEETLTLEMEETMQRSGVSDDPRFTAALREKGWLAPDWPEALGGQGRDPLEMIAFREEMNRAHAPVYGIMTTLMVGKVIQTAGNSQMKDEIIPKAVNGEIIIALGFTEPESGSDVAAAQCRAERDGDSWIINGQKMFTTNAQIADYVFLLTRTDPSVPKHQGLTMFLVPIKEAAVEAQAVYTLSGERTNITFYTDLRVPDSARVGEVNGGWGVLTQSLQDEHTSGFGPPLEALVEAAETWAHEVTGSDGRALINESRVRDRLARAATDSEISKLLYRRAAWLSINGRGTLAEGPMSKLFSSEALVRRSQDLTELMGADGVRSHLDPSAPVEGRVEYSMRFALGTTTYAGTSEVHRNIIASRGLGLPRSS